MDMHFSLSDKVRLEPCSNGRIYVVGDIHGRLDCLEEIHDKIRADSLGAIVRGVVYLGDYIDRGPESREVIDELLSADIGMKKYFLLGNHEYALREFLKGNIPYRIWKSWGADPTLVSYGLKTSMLDEECFPQNELRRLLLEAIPELHKRFFSELLPYCIDDEFIYVHAGIRPEVHLKNQLLEDLIMIRDEFLYYPRIFPQKVVYGHTIFNVPNVKEDRIGIDTGAYRTGRLTALVLESGGVRFLST